MIKIVTLGDSITSGWNSDPPGGPCCGWFNILSNRLPQYEWVNIAQGGTTSVFWSENIETLLPEGDILMILLGSNDAHPFAGRTVTNPLSYAGNLLNIIDNARSKGYQEIILTGPTQSTSIILEVLPDVDIRLQDYNTWVDGICTTLEDVTCGPDLYTEIGSGLPNFTLNDIHPNTVGHTLIADLFEPIVIPEPEISAMFGIGLILLAFLGRKRNIV